MDELLIDSVEFASLSKKVLAAGGELRFTARGGSMHPFIQSADTLVVRPIDPADIRVGDVVLYESSEGRMLVHRVVALSECPVRRLLVQGDSLPHPDGWIDSSQAIGILAACERRGKSISVNPPVQRLLARLRWMPAARFLRSSIRTLLPFVLGLSLVWVFIAVSWVASAGSEIAVDPVEPSTKIGQASLDPGTMNSTSSFDDSGFKDAGFNFGKPVVVAQDSAGVTIELALPQFTLETLSAGGRPCQVIHLPGYGETDEIGSPRLPIKGAMLGLPSNASPVVTLLEADLVQAEGQFELCPQQAPIVERSPSGEPIFAGYASERDHDAYRQNAFSPTPAVQLLSTGIYPQPARRRNPLPALSIQPGQRFAPLLPAHARSSGFQPSRSG